MGHKWIQICEILKWSQILFCSPVCSLNECFRINCPSDCFSIFHISGVVVVTMATAKAAKTAVPFLTTVMESMGWWRCFDILVGETKRMNLIVLCLKKCVMQCKFKALTIFYKVHCPYVIYYSFRDTVLSHYSIQTQVLLTTMMMICMHPVLLLQASLANCSCQLLNVDFFHLLTANQQRQKNYPLLFLVYQKLSQNMRPAN